jgi:hypothetical protein
MRPRRVSNDEQSSEGDKRGQSRSNVNTGDAFLMAVEAGAELSGTWDGKIVWEWRAHEHFDELGFDENAREVLRRDPNVRPAGGGVGDWLHINSLSVLGPIAGTTRGTHAFIPTT